MDTAGLEEEEVEGTVTDWVAKVADLTRHMLTAEMVVGSDSEERVPRPLEQVLQRLFYAALQPPR